MEVTVVYLMQYVRKSLDGNMDKKGGW